MSSSSSSTDQKVSQSDNRKVLGQGAIDSGGGNVTQVSNVLDGGAVANSLATVLNSQAMSNNLVQDTVHQTISAITTNTGAALGFGTASMGVVQKATTDALNFAKTSQAQSEQTASSALSSALSLSQNALTSSLAFAKGQSDQAYSTLNSAENMVSAAYSDAKGQGALTSKIMIGAVVVMGIVAVMAVKK